MIKCQTLMDNIGGIQEQMGNVRRELETKNKKTVLEIKKHCSKNEVCLS